MTTALLVVIAVMWLPVALLNLGKGEAKGTGAATGFVGIVVVLGAIIQAAVFKDAFTAGLLFAHGVLYCCVFLRAFDRPGRFEVRGQCQLDGGDHFADLHGHIPDRGTGAGGRKPARGPELVFGAGLSGLRGAYLRGMVGVLRKIVWRSGRMVFDRLGGSRTLGPRFLADDIRQASFFN